jgi:hypothetical protein
MSSGSLCSQRYSRTGVRYSYRGRPYSFVTLIDITLPSQVLPHALAAQNTGLYHISEGSVSFPPTLTNTSPLSTIRHDISTYRGQFGHRNTYSQVRAYFRFNQRWGMIRLHSNSPVKAPFSPPSNHIQANSSIAALVLPVVQIKISTTLV